MGKVLYLYYNLKNRKKGKSAEYLMSKLSITFHHFFHIFLQITSEGFFVVYYLGNNYLTTWLIKICAPTVSTSSTSLFQKSEKECTKLLIVWSCNLAAQHAAVFLWQCTWEQVENWSCQGNSDFCILFFSLGHDQALFPPVWCYSIPRKWSLQWTSCCWSLQS